MDAFNQITTTLALTMGVAWASGINLYATLLALGLLAQSGNLVLPQDLQILSNPLVIAAAGFMYFIEFFADKTPGVDTAWDSLHTFIRIPAGAMLAAGAIGELNPAVELAAAIVGGGLAASTHITKAGTRLLINSSPEPFSNWLASIGEDIAVIVAIWSCVQHPLVFLIVLGLIIILMAWWLPHIWTAIKKLFTAIGRLFQHDPTSTS